MPAPRRALPPPPRSSARPFVIAIVHEATGRIERKVNVSEATARRISELLDAAGDVAGAVGDLVRAGRAIGDVLDRIAPPPRRLPSRGRR